MKRYYKVSRGNYWYHSLNGNWFHIYRYDDGLWGCYTEDGDCLWVDNTRKWCVAFVEGHHPNL